MNETELRKRNIKGLIIIFSVVALIVAITIISVVFFGPTGGTG
ncbi:MAG: hypothetical protein ACFE9X_13560 [Promethearchaeota archaeon]